MGENDGTMAESSVWQPGWPGINCRGYHDLHHCLLHHVHAVRQIKTEQINTSSTNGKWLRDYHEVIKQS